MSADNGIYIGVFDRPGGLEYRVIHAQAIENCDYDPKYPKKLTEANIIQYYHNAKVFLTEDEAKKEANRLYEEYSEDGFSIEYGICTINYGPFPDMTPEQADEFIREYYTTIISSREGEAHAS